MTDKKTVYAGTPPQSDENTSNLANAMERKLELVKLVLEFIEQNQKDDKPITAASIVIDGYSQEEVYHTVRLLDGEGFILVYASEIDRKNYLPSHAMPKVNIHRLTWDGHDFLGNTRDTVSWEATKKTASNFSLKIISQVLEKLVLHSVTNTLKGMGLL